MDAGKIRQEASFCKIFGYVGAEKGDGMNSEGCVFFSDLFSFDTWHGALKGRQYTYLLRAASDQRAATCFQRAVHFSANDIAALEGGIMSSKDGSVFVRSA